MSSLPPHLILGDPWAGLEHRPRGRPLPALDPTSQQGQTPVGRYRWRDCMLFPLFNYRFLNWVTSGVCVAIKPTRTLLFTRMTLSGVTAPNAWCSVCTDFNKVAGVSYRFPSEHTAWELLKGAGLSFAKNGIKQNGAFVSQDHGVWDLGATEP